MRISYRQTPALFALLFALFLAGLDGCAAKKPIGSPPVTTWEQVNSDNAQIAVHNRAVAKALVATRNAGFLSTEYFGTLSAAQIKITRLHAELTPLLRDVNTALAAQDRIKAILDEFTALAIQMVSDGSAGIKNPQSQSQIISEIQAIRSLVDSLRSLLQTAGVKGVS